MHFALVDRIVERDESRLVAIKHVTSAEEYLQDHFPGFPVLPGVMMFEAMVHAARALVAPRAPGQRLVLGRARALRFGRFVKPGDTLRIEITLLDSTPEGEHEFRADARLLNPLEPGAAAPAAASGRLTLRPARAPG